MPVVVDLLDDDDIMVIESPPFSRTSTSARNGHLYDNYRYHSPVIDLTIDPARKRRRKNKKAPSTLANETQVVQQQATQNVSTALSASQLTPCTARPTAQSEQERLLVTQNVTEPSVTFLGRGSGTIVEKGLTSAQRAGRDGARLVNVPKDDDPSELFIRSSPAVEPSLPDDSLSRAPVANMIVQPSFGLSPTPARIRRHHTEVQMSPDAVDDFTVNCFVAPKPVEVIASDHRYNGPDEHSEQQKKSREKVRRTQSEKKLDSIKKDIRAASVRRCSLYAKATPTLGVVQSVKRASDTESFSAQEAPSPRPSLENRISSSNHTLGRSRTTCEPEHLTNDIARKNPEPQTVSHSIVRTESDSQKWDGYHCPLCLRKHISRHHLKRHFKLCVERNGNPEGKSFNSHESWKALSHGTKTFAREPPRARLPNKQSTPRSFQNSALQDIRAGVLCNPSHVQSRHELEKRAQKVEQITRRAWTGQHDHISIEDDNDDAVPVEADHVNTSFSSQAHSDSSNTSITKTDSLFQRDAAQDSDTSVEAEYTPKPGVAGTDTQAERPTTGGKCISAETLAVWEPQSAEETETPEVIYVYFVNIRTWALEKADEEHYSNNSGPFYTLQEANMVAKEEVKYPLDHIQSGMEEITASPGWSYTYTEDEHQMQTHKMSAAGLCSETTVRRELPPPPNRHALAASAFKTPPAIYIVQTLVRYHQSPSSLAASTHNNSPNDDLFDDEPLQPAATPDCEKSTLGAYTALDLANKRAGDFYLELATQGMSSKGAQGVRKSEIEMNVRRELQELNEEGDMFQKTVEFEEDADGDGEGEEGGRGGILRCGWRRWEMGGQEEREGRWQGAEVAPASGVLDHGEVCDSITHDAPTPAD
ncbi:uncharacterized protein KY384_003047 [Bacidia gigantensis]|uniref:uncharacterized protein n=1 Tax=Bacidia gigantensis TaxID=2732470 RepID=UPI001D03FCDB|nr:uncharacterized protein KY384_003047 [Bacidia gigantensis]KAG8531418.1 hypothetical protein KY384_003047 [Bacidia gigantensis]